MKNTYIKPQIKISFIQPRRFLAGSIDVNTGQNEVTGTVGNNEVEEG